MIVLAVLQRLAFGVLVLLAITYLTFFGLDMARGVAFQSALIQAVDSTVSYLALLAQGDLGMTTAGSITLIPIPVAQVLPAALLNSLVLLLTALIIAAVFGITLGIWASKRRKSNVSLLILLVSIIGVSIPSFFAAFVLQLTVIQLTRRLGYTLLPVGGYGFDAHIILPALVLATRPLAHITRATFGALNDVLEQDYIRTAYSKGLTERLVLNRHVIRNAAVTVLTAIGVSLRFSLSSLPVVEYFFAWPGVGFTLLKSISKQDDNLTVALILSLGILFIIVNILLDVGYRLIDPRLRDAPEHIARSEHMNVFRAIRTSFISLIRYLAGNPIKKWFESRQAQAPPPRDPFRQILDKRGDTPVDFDEGKRGERNLWLKGTLFNLPFVIGILFLLGLGVVFLFGPNLSPHSPYTTRGLTIVDGEFSVPPFEPDDIYPWGTDVLGRDLQSLILAGAQQTLLLAVLVVLARLITGFVLGALAGWFNGSWIDRTLLGAAEIIAAFPTLLLAMILILALGIQNGIRPFIIALCFVGWGEIMQFVRSEVMTIRPKSFIESAVALGLRTPNLILRHVLPNLIPALISIAALEMGAVLMLLGELGFLGIFIGGGAFAELDIASPPYHYSDVPEWGALLSNVRIYVRAYPWTALYISLAFFVAILGFNLLGEGLRRMVEIVGVRVMRLFNRYTFAVGLVVMGGFIWVRGSTGALSFYQRQASEFDGQNAMVSVAVLADPVLEGRALGSRGLDIAAEHIAGQFEELGIQAAGDDLTYFQPRLRDYESLEEIPQLYIEDGGSDLVYRQDYVERPGGVRNLGAAHTELKFVALGEIIQSGWNTSQSPTLRKLDYKDEILIALTERDVQLLSYVPHAGMLVVVEDPLDLQRRSTQSIVDPFYNVFGVNRLQGQDIPVMWISEQVAERLLQGSGYSLDDLHQTAENLGLDEIMELSVDSTASMEIQGALHEKVEVNHVIGHWPGMAGGGAGISAEEQLDDNLIVVLAQYDSPPIGPEGNVFPAANTNASGVAVMLEAIRAMKESEYQPSKTFLFVAYSGEGEEWGERVTPEVSKFLQTKYGFSSNYVVEAIVELRGMGSMQGERLILNTGGSHRLAKLFESAARRMGVPVKSAGNAVDISVVFVEGNAFDSGEEAPSIGLSWEGMELTSFMIEDDISSVSADHLEKAGRALSLALMILGRETDY